MATTMSTTMEKKKRHQQSMSNSKIGDLRRRSSMISGGGSIGKIGRKPAAPPASPVSGPMKKRVLERRRSDVSQLKKVSPAYVDENHEPDKYSKCSFTSSFSSSYTSRSTKGWEANKGGLRGSRREMNPPSRTQSTSVSPARSGSFRLKEDAAIELMSASKRNAERAYNAVSSNTQRKPSVSAPCSCSENSGMVPFFSFNYVSRNQERIGFNWACLTPSLVKHGKEILKHRDLALQAAVEVMLEASVSERLVQCLSTYSELQSEKDCDAQHLVDKFLTLHQDLAYTRLIIHSAPKLGPPKTSNCNLVSMASTKSLNEIALERRACATSWIRAALESGLHKFPNEGSVASDSTEIPATNESLLSSYSHLLKTIIPKESSLLAALNDLQQECNRCLLRFLEKFLHSVHKEIQYGERVTLAVDLLCQLKRVDHWLNTITSNRSKESLLPETEETEACARIRTKIYSILLRHSETAAFALERMSTRERAGPIKQEKESSQVG